MKNMKKVLAMLLTAAMLFAMLVPMAALAADEVPTIPEGASFEAIDPERTGGATVYAYLPKGIGDLGPMLTAVVMVYGDKPYADKDAAWNALCGAGLFDIANEEKAMIMMVNPLGEGWSEADVSVFKALQDVTWGTWMNHYFRFWTYQDLMYAVGEGSGATFINQYVTQNASKLAAVATFGGTMPQGVSTSVALPAYISAGSRSAINYYRNVNQTNAEKTAEGKTEYYNTRHTTKRVVVNADGPSAFDSETMRDAWKSVLRRTTRNVMGFPLYENKDTDEVLTLMDRPMVNELALTFSECVDREKLPAQQRWYEWVPNEVFDTMADPENDTTYPLVVCYHGMGDHPVFEAESNGWAALAGQERFILVSPETNGNTADNIKLIDYIKAKYPVDASRIYLAGFSMGGANTISTTGDYPEVFAAAAPMAAPPINSFVSDTSADIDLPFMIVLGSKDMHATTGNPTHLAGLQSTLKAVLELNEIENSIDLDAPDYEAHPFYGFETPEMESKMTKHGIQFDTITYEKNGIGMVKMLVSQGLNHNHYTEYAAEIWDFFKNFSRDPETKAVIYTQPNEIKGSSVTAKCGEGETAQIDFTYTGTAEVTSVRAQLSCDEFDVIEVISDYDFEFNPANGKVVVYSTEGFKAGDVLFTAVCDLDIDPWISDGIYDVNISVIEATNSDVELMSISGKAGRIVIDNAYPLGDVNMDNTVDNRDLIMIARYLVDLEEFDAKQMKLADYNEDGSINNIDLVLIAKAIAA